MSFVNEPIAVIGTGCRFPGQSTSPSKLWQLLKQPRDVLRKIDRFRAENWYNTDGHHHGASNVLDAYLLAEDPRAFDSQFFNIQAGEADSIDPQQRVLLETIYEAVESAGVTLESLQEASTAVYVGVMCDDYSEVIYNDAETIPKYAATGSARSILSNRVSYFFNWTGPSMTIDTACSSSLVAVHQAVQVLRSGESRAAVAAGSNLIFGPKMFIAESNLNMLSPTGRSRMWDADADGYARGEGVASILMKRLSDAIADGDHIECIIRETGVNQDGRTPGITMPSSIAQAALIRQTYAKAGLDLTKKSDRPQYFEAHGTGTKAGDPQEARAIHTAFFGEDSVTDSEDFLHVGSIKTVVGHTEGTAGVAGLIKASLAIQNKTIPPNRLFNRLNPDLEPYYDHLRIPTKAQAWPELPAGIPRRASVNSFGFGGTNAHAIIESYEPEAASASTTPSTDVVSLPFVFSATSEKSLAAQLRAYVNFLSENKEINLQDVASTLSRRSAFTFRASFSASTAEGLSAKLEKALEAKQADNTPVGTRPVNKGRGILGVFTGQGAQWAAMGRELILTSPFVERVIDELEQSLADLPENDRPSWSLKEEMLKFAPESRIGEGLFSQPLCTAIQVALVELLHKAGINFEAVVGHSSGEIGAAYAAGFISARDAIRIAYYRGLYAKLAKGPNGQQGSMLAAGTDLQDAKDLCELPFFEGRLQVAASNSSSSVTLSGDLDAVLHAKDIFDDESKFARQLKVDTAYHSHHMIPCSDIYVKSLDACNIEILTPPENAPRWYSSVLGGPKVTPDLEGLKSVYWKDNMLNPVLFSQALTAALADIEAPAVALEVGPHPALKGPASGTIEEALGSGIPYSGVLSRGNNDLEAFADGLGFLWTAFGPSAVDFASYAQLFNKEAGATSKLLKTLPSYTWDHNRAYWYESRASKTQRLRKEVPHELLGVRTSDEVEGEHRWRNYIKPGEIPWLRGHAIQGQVLFPAAGFAAMAIEASKVLAPSTDVCLIELHNFSIHRALSFPDEAAGVETLFTLYNVQEHNGAERYISASFGCDGCQNKESGSFTSLANGQLVLRLGQPSATSLPERPAPLFKMTDVDVDEFYSSLANTGYNYTELFRGISELQRTTDLSSGKIFIPADPEHESSFTVHPATLDVAFQAVFAAIGAPGDGRLWTLHVPTKIDKIKVNPFSYPAGAGLGVELPFNANLAPSEAYEVNGDVEIYEEGGRHSIVQVQGLHVSPLSTPGRADDRPMFAETTWGYTKPDAELSFKEWDEDDFQKRLGTLSERTSLFYLNRLQKTITPEEREKCDWHQTAVLNWAVHIVSLTSQGIHPILKKEWLNDTYENLYPYMLAMCVEYEDFKNQMFVGERLIPFVRGEISMLEEFRNNNMLEWLYKGSDGTVEYNAYVGDIVKQIAHRYPYMDILEIGAGTGSATQAVIKKIGYSYSSYTYTDISSSFFDDAMAVFADHSDKFVYKVLDISNDGSEQGFSPNSYDLIVAANVLHATPFLEETLSNTRRLLKPGGFLVLFEITEVDWLRTGFMFAGMSGWWAGDKDGRPYSPTVPKSTWDSLFRRTGFSGIDTATPDSKGFMTPYSVMVTQAVDSQMNLIRQPLSATPTKPIMESLMIVGGQKMSTYELAEEVSTLLEPLCSNITIVDKLEDLNDSSASKHTVLSLAELDEPVFKPFTTEKYTAVQNLSEQARNILWVVQGSRGDRPYSNMMLGIARCLVSERKEDLHMQYLDFQVDQKPDPKLIAETLLRMHISDSWKQLPTPYDPVWTLEREMFVVNDKIEIPRYKPSAALDDRYNSTRRLITNAVSLDESTIAVTSSGSSYQLEESKPALYELQSAEQDLRTIRVQKSILNALKIKDAGLLYLALGEDVHTKQKVLALSEHHRSTISVPKDWTVDIEVSQKDDSSFLLKVANEILAESILGKSGRKGSYLVHEPTPLLAGALTRQAAKKNVRVAFTTAKSSISGFTYVHPSASERLIASYIPADVSVFVELSEDSHSESIGARLERYLPAKCKCKTAASFLGQEGFIRSDLTQDAPSKALSAAYSRATNGSSTPETEALDENVDVSLNDLAGVSTDNTLRTVDWTTTTTVPVKVTPSENDAQFRGDKTYFLVGLTGELGLSLTKWMVARGARYIVLTSRNPKIDPQFLDAMAAQGATIKVYSLDITNRASLMSVYKTIRKELPPIAGVCNGAMVLIDGMFATMPYEDFNKVIRPKVDGTIFLDQLFSENNLDFFIVFSSLTYVTGNIGQTPYAAANAFMVSMAENRRKRGLAGSVMNLAGIFGIGYIARTDKSIHERLGNMGYANISEYDYLQFFAEAVFASPASSGRQWQISNGLKSFDPEKDTNLPAWINIPKFANYKIVRNSASGGKTDKSNISVKAQLQEQNSLEGVEKVLLAGLLSVLYRQLNIPPEENSITPESSLVELGIDSLVAVDLRSWFTNELELDIPVIKLLGGATVAGLVEDCLGRLSPELIPNVKSDTPQTEEEKTDSSKSSSPSLEASTPSLNTDTPPSSRVSEIGEPMIKVDGLAIQQAQPKLEFEKTVRMSYGSSQFWFLTQYLEDPNVFNIQFRMSMSGTIQVNRLERAIEALGQRHEAFRTAFFANPDKFNEPTQGVLSQSQLRLEKKNITDLKDAEIESQNMLHHTFDIERGEVVKTVLLTLNPTTHFMIFGFHHIAIDGFSFNLLLTELNALYEGRQLPPIGFQFSDFAFKQREEVEGGKMAQELEFWRNELRKVPDPLPLFPMAKINSRLALTHYDYEEADEVILDSKTSLLIKDLCRRQKSTKFHFFLAAFKTFLFRFLDAEDLCIGLADANRTDSSTNGTIGYLLNLLPLRFENKAAQKFSDAIKEARDKSYAALAHSRLPFDLILDNLKIERSSTHSPLFQVFMDYRQITAKAPLLGAQSDGVSTPGRTAYDLILDISEVGSEIRITFRSQKSLYSRESTETLLKSYIQLVKSFAANAEASVEKAQLFNPQDINFAKQLGRGQLLEIGSPDTASLRIDDVIIANSESVALKDGLGNVLTYSQLGERVNTISSSLLDAGVRENTCVAVYQEPTSDWVCSLLAIWKVGAAFVPLDPRNPMQRLATIANDCKPAAILCHEQTSIGVAELKPTSTKVIDITNLVQYTRNSVVLNRSKADSPAMILYTSGSTGVPKGAILSHSGILNMVIGYNNKHQIGKENMLQQSAYSFDMALWQVTTAFIAGGSVFVASKDQRLDPTEIAKIMSSEKITSSMATPSEYLNWLRYGSEYMAQARQWAHAVAGGERLSHGLINEFRALQNPKLRLINIYGPSEISVGCTTVEVDYLNMPEDSDVPVPIGSAVPNYSVYVVDKDMNLLPAGVTGEIVVGGPGVCLGYLNNDKLTRAKFLPDPFDSSKEGATIYKTGDLGRLQSDGLFMYQGRMAGDTQVKLHGIRVEMSDIENTILEAAGGAILSVVASVRGETGFLVAHVEFSQEFPPSERASFLKGLMSRLPLPKYMCPSMIVPVDNFPLNSHGKTDRRAVAALPLPLDIQDNENDEFLSETEAALKHVWEKAIPKEVAETVKIRSDSDFFHVGGDSLLLVSLQSLIRERFDVTLPMADLFESSTLRSMATKIETTAPVAHINWDLETSLEEAILSSQWKETVEVPASRKTSSLTVLLTGATGYLGRHFLQQLVDDERVSTIHCVAVRNSSSEPREMPLTSSKIITHTGNLSEPLLGLSEEEFSSLASEVDAILHSGANRSFWDYYQVLRGSNFWSTKELTKLAAVRKVPLHFISSSGVLRLNGEDIDDTVPISSRQFQPPVDGTAGYVASKWASEAYLEKAAEVLGLPIQIHRVTSAPTDREPSAELLDEFSGLARQMNCLPDHNGWDGTFDLISTRTLAQQVCNSVLGGPSNVSDPSAATIMHYQSEVRLHMADVLKHLGISPEDRASFDALPPHEWGGKAKRLGLGWHFASQDLEIGKGNGAARQLNLRR